MHRITCRYGNFTKDVLMKLVSLFDGGASYETRIPFHLSRTPKYALPDGDPMEDSDTYGCH